MLYRIFATKDTTITNRYVDGARMTGSNTGGSEIITVAKEAGISGSGDALASSSLTRALVQFDIARLRALSSAGILPSSGVSYRLRMRHATLPDTLPRSYTMMVLPVSRSWDEGRGIDDETMLDSGYANWQNAKSTVPWTLPGGDVLASPAASMSFDSGEESLDVDVSALVSAWLSGTITDNGLMLRMEDAVEADSNYADYTTKGFYGRTSNFLDRRPYIEASWDDFRGDDRSRFKWNASGTLYFTAPEALEGFSPGGNVYMSLADLSGSRLAVTASYVSGRTYSATFALPTGSQYSGSLFYDRWGSGSFAYATGTLSFERNIQTLPPTSRKLAAKVTNLNNEYTTDDWPRLRVNIRRQSFTPVVHQSGSGLFDAIPLSGCYYAIENDSTRERVVSFGTGSVRSTRLSYDADGNYFDFPMSNLHQGNVYRILILIDDSGTKQVFDGSFKFKVV